MTQEDRRTAEVHLRAAVESSPSGLLMVDPDGRIVLVNREIERLFGYSREELLGQSVDMLVPDNMREGHSGFREAFLRDPRVRAMGEGRDLHGLRKDGTRVPVEIGLTPVATEKGMFILSAVVDISARRRAEAHFRAAVESSPAGMIMVDPDGCIILINREVERLFGYDREDLVGKSIEVLVPERFRDRHPGFRAGFFAAPDTRAMGAGRDLFGLRRDGSEVPVEIGLNPIETEDGTLVLASIVDISARQKEEADRKELEAQLREAQKLEAVGTLAGGVAHDFNNILSAILGYAELLEDQVEESQARQDLGELKQFVHRGRSLVKRIQAFSRRQKTKRVPLSLDLPLEEVTKFLRSSVSPSIEIDSTVHPDLPRVLADPSAMHQVLMNLGMNAVHSMGTGGRLSIELGTEYVTDSKARRHPGLAEGRHAILSVRDTGGGIPEEVRDRVFEPFFTTKAPGQGSGLGLSIVHGIVLEHDGAIELDSTVGVGTTVKVFLPAVDLHEPEVEPDRETPRGTGERILLVDDEPGLGAVGRRRLQTLGYDVTVVGDGVQALETFRAAPHEFDAVITDYLMPRMNGLELARAIRSLRADIPLILLTGYVENLPQTEILATGVDEVLSKPATVQELGTRLRTLLDQRGERTQ